MRKISIARPVVLLVALAVGLAFTPTSAPADDVVVVPMHPPGGPPPGSPFPTGWAVINYPRGEVTMLAILPKNTTVPEATFSNVAPGTWVFEGWLADPAPPHRCPPVSDPPDPGVDEIDPSAVRLGDEALVGSDEIVDPTGGEPVPICGSRRSSETGFRGFPGFVNKTFQHTYFPRSQGLLRKVGQPLGNWQFYVLNFKNELGLVPYDVVGVTVEPPGTGARFRDYDPRPNPLVALIGRIPRFERSSDEPGGDGSGGDGGGAASTRPRPRPAGPVDIR